MPPDKGCVYYLAIPQPPTYDPQLLTAAIDIGCSNAIKIVGTGSVQLSMLTGNDIFYVNTKTTSGDNIGGVTFENLHLRYMNPETAGAAIHVAALALSNDNHGNPTNDGAQNVRINGCVFTDCPVSVWFEQALQCSMFQCTSNLAQTNGTAIKIGGPWNGSKDGTGKNVLPLGKDIFITDCVFEVTGSVTNNIAMQIIAAEHVRLSNVRFDNFDHGIQIVPGQTGYGGSPSGQNVVRCYFSDVTVYVGLNSSGVGGTALTIQPQNSGANPQAIAQLSFESCLFEPGGNLDGIATVGAGITLDANGATIDTVRFVSCYAARWSGPGLSIGVPLGSGTIQNVEVLGGMYAGNNAVPASPGPYPYGIAVFSPCQRVRIVGVSCTGQYQYVTASSSLASVQQVAGIYLFGASKVVIDGCDLSDNAKYGLFIDGGASDVSVSDCNMESAGTNGVYIQGQPAATTTNVFIRGCDVNGYGHYYTAINVNAAHVGNVEITDCAGYNDLGALVTATSPASAALFTSASLGYYGPITFYVSNSLTGTVSLIQINSTNVFLKTGAFTLAPGNICYATITYSGTNPNFFAFGY